MDPWAGISNLRAQYPSMLNGTYFGKRSSARRRLIGKRILGVQAAIITWCLFDIMAAHDRKWWGKKGTCQQFRMRKQMYCPAAKTQMCASPVPSIIMSWPKAVRWTLRPGVYVVNKEQSVMGVLHQRPNMIELDGTPLVVSLWEWSWLCNEMKIQKNLFLWNLKAY